MRGRLQSLAQPPARTCRHHVLWMLIAVWGVLLLAGCTHSNPTLTPGTPADAANSVGVAVNRLEDPGLRKFIEQQLHRPVTEWPLRRWNFSTLSLAALYFDPAFQVARQQSRSASTASVMANEGKVASDQSPDWFSPEFSLPQAPSLHSIPTPADRAPAESPRPPAGLLSQTEHQARASILHAATIAWQVRSNLYTSVVAYAAAQRGEALLQTLESNQVQVIRLAELREAAGGLSSSELLQMRLQLAQVRLALIQARLSRMSTREHLAHSLNLPVIALLAVEVTFDFSGTPADTLTLAHLRDQALHLRPDLLQLLGDFAEAEGLLQSEIAKRDPRHPLPSGCVWDRMNRRWTVNLNLDLSTSLHRRPAVARAEARRNAAAAHLLSLQSSIIDQVERAVAVCHLTANDAADIDFLVASVRQHHDTLQARYEAGLASAWELLLARVQLNTAVLFELESQVRLQQALGSVENALHQPVKRITLPHSITQPKPTGPPTPLDRIQERRPRDALFRVIQEPDPSSSSTTPTLLATPNRS